MKLILVVIAFLIDTNVIAGPASFWSMENEITVLNACSQDPPCLVSCIIGFEDVKLYTSPILASAVTSYFPYANTTNGLRVTIFKHIDVQDPGTIIITKKLGDDEDTCFVVRGDYSSPIISKCLNGKLGEMAIDKARIKIKNRSTPSFVVKIIFYEGDRVVRSLEVFGGETNSLDYYVNEDKPPATGFLHFVMQKRDPDAKKIYYENIKEVNELSRAVDICVLVHGNFTSPTVMSIPCVEF